VTDRALPILGVAAALGLWELAPRVGWVRAQSLPPCSDVLQQAVTILPDVAPALAASGARWATGLGVALVIGVPVGLLMGRSRAVRALVDPLLVAGYPVPKAALILLFVLWWGAGDTARIAVVAAGCLIPLVISAEHGAAAVPPALLWSARALGTRWLFWRVVLPAALPDILSGLRIALAVAIFTVLASELLIRGSGIGSYMFTALDNGQTLTVFAVSTIVATLGFLADLVYVFAVRRGLPWLEGEL
jgi:ABC-type nitrate/sulfonate/bicarbonate transport system permease component